MEDIETLQKQVAFMEAGNQAGFPMTDKQRIWLENTKEVLKTNINYTYHEKQITTRFHHCSRCSSLQVHILERWKG